MKKLAILCMAIFGCFCATKAQTTIYLDTINSTGSNWSLDDTDLGGITTGTPNAWLINNAYTGGSFSIVTIPNTSDQPAAITGNPESYYLHICSAAAQTHSIFNTNFNASSLTSKSYFASMSNSVSTVGYTGVYYSFWWLCAGGSPSAVGEAYYRTSAGGSWVQITGTTFAGSTSWSVDSVHLDSFDNKPFLQFAFRFKHTASGSDPAFAVDQIRLSTASSVVSTPVASFTSASSTACQDSCITFTNTSIGTVDSVRWDASPAGATIASPTSTTSTSICFPASGAYSVTLTAYNSSGSNSSTSVINITPTPHPSITQTGAVLSVPAVYTTYQWYNGLSAITGATTNTYTITATSTYGIVVDSAGCPGGDTLTTGPLHVATVNNFAGNYWIAQPNSSNLVVNSSKPVDDALAITIFDATGRKILDEKWDAGSYSKQINALSVANGLYVIKLSNIYTSVVLKWLKQ